MTVYNESRQNVLFNEGRQQLQMQWLKTKPRKASLLCLWYLAHRYNRVITRREVGGWGRDPFSRNLMKPTPRRKWYLTTGRRFH